MTVTADIINCAISGNTSTSGGYGGIYALGGSVVTVTNTILWNTSAPYELGKGLGAIITATYSNINGGYVGTGNINADPLFVDDTNANLLLRDYHLSIITSPCVDTGTATGAPATDRDGDARPIGGGIDIGSDEAF